MVALTTVACSTTGTAPRDTPASAPLDTPASAPVQTPASASVDAPASVTAAPPGESGTATAPPTVAADRPFAPTSPFNVPVVDAPALDPDSAAMIARVSRAGLGHANLVEFGIPIYEATPATPRRPVICTITEWGPCPLADDSPRPIPDDAAPGVGRDAPMVVIDRAADTADEYFQAARDGDG